MTGGHEWVSSQLYSQSVNFKRRGRDAAPKSTRLNRAMLELPRLKIGEQAPGPTLEATEAPKRSIQSILHVQSPC